MVLNPVSHGWFGRVPLDVSRAVVDGSGSVVVVLAVVLAVVVAGQRSCQGSVDGRHAAVLFRAATVARQAASIAALCSSLATGVVDVVVDVLVVRSGRRGGT